MGVLAKMLGERQKEIEEDAINSCKYDGGIDFRIVVNKILIKLEELNLDWKTSNNATMTANRLNKLVLLIDIAYRHKYKKPLIKDGYVVWGYGLAISNMHDEYLFNKGIDPKISMSHNQKVFQEKVEQTIDKKLNTRVNLLVSEILEITNYLDMLDLVPILKNQTWQEFRKVYPEHEMRSVPQELVDDIYTDFSFEELKLLNEELKVKSKSI